jgi:hypothetical protein
MGPDACLAAREKNGSCDALAPGLPATRPFNAGPIPGGGPTWGAVAGLTWSLVDDGAA